MGRPTSQEPIIIFYRTDWCQSHQQLPFNRSLAGDCPPLASALSTARRRLLAPHVALAALSSLRMHPVGMTTLISLPARDLTPTSAIHAANAKFPIAGLHPSLSSLSEPTKTTSSISSMCGTDPEPKPTATPPARARFSATLYY
jgi:hypothetical protein